MWDTIARVRDIWESPEFNVTLGWVMWGGGGSERGESKTRFSSQEAQMCKEAGNQNVWNIREELPSPIGW